MMPQSIISNQRLGRERESNRRSSVKDLRPFCQTKMLARAYLHKTDFFLRPLSGTWRPKLHSGARACRRGSLEIIINPENGWLSSKIRKIAHDADSAKRDRQMTTVPFKSENRLKLANMMTSQRTKMTRNGVGIALPDSVNRMRRVCTKSVLSCPARV